MTRSYAPVENWVSRKRNGVIMTHKQMDVLLHLRQAKELDPECPYTALDGVYKSIINALTEKGWVWFSPGLDGTKYYISVHGERALRIFEKPTGKRYDGICPDCGIRPKHISSSGRKSGYCLECGNRLGRRKYHHGVPKGSSDNGNCPRCNKRPRHVLPGGKQTTYCDYCTRVLKRRNKRKNKQRLIEKARRGELMCIRCKKNPRHFTEKSVYDYCFSCWSAYLIEYNDRRRPNSRAARRRRGMEAST